MYFPLWLFLFSSLIRVQCSLPCVATAAGPVGCFTPAHSTDDDAWEEQGKLATNITSLATVHLYGTQWSLG